MIERRKAAALTVAAATAGVPALGHATPAAPGRRLAARRPLLGKMPPSV